MLGAMNVDEDLCSLLFVEVACSTVLVVFVNVFCVMLVEVAVVAAASSQNIPGVAVAIVAVAFNVVPTVVCTIL